MQKTLRKLRPEDCQELKASQSYVAGPSLNMWETTVRCGCTRLSSQHWGA